MSSVKTPIITILGHVDHGKTTLLDTIRGADVQSSEAGGITQKVSVFTVNVSEDDDRQLTFIDTPGHEAFDLMRTRGGAIADVVLLVIAGDDGVMPQTKESIEVIKNSNSKCIVVVNKADLPTTDVEKVKRELSANEMLVEGYGGDIPVVEVSALKGEGIDTLLETIGALIELEELDQQEEMDEEANGRAYVLESIKEPSKGYVSSAVVTNGELNVGNWIAYRYEDDIELEKIKGFISESDENIEELSQGEGGLIIGLSNPVDPGSLVFSMDSKDQKLAKKLLPKPKKEEVEAQVEGELEEDAVPDWLTETLEDEDDKSESGELSVMLKASSEGSLEAIVNKLDGLTVDNYELKIVKEEVGDITPNDIEYAQITKSIILGFEVELSTVAKDLAREKKVLARTYEIIYELLEEVEDVLTAMATPDEIEEEIGVANIKQVFTLSDNTQVIGGRVEDGKVQKGSKVYVVRAGDIVGEGKIASLKRNKDDIKEAQKGAEFGAIVDPKIKGVEEGDELRCFKIVKT